MSSEVSMGNDDLCKDIYSRHTVLCTNPQKTGKLQSSAIHPIEEAGNVGFSPVGDAMRTLAFHSTYLSGGSDLADGSTVQGHTNIYPARS
jgi:hypothetical protein